MTVSLWCYNQKRTDGVKSLFFNTQSEAESFAAGDIDRLPNDIALVSLSLNHDGKLTTIPTR